MSTQVEQTVKRIAVSREYVERKLSLGPGTHLHRWDREGRCLYCSKVMVLREGARTGELIEVGE